jgi:hypothetical protein
MHRAKTLHLVDARFAIPVEFDSGRKRFQPSADPGMTRGQHPRTVGRWICNAESLPIQPGNPSPSTNATPKGISGNVSAIRVISASARSDIMIQSLFSATGSS